MSMFILTISGLNMSNLPWFMNLTLQVPLKYCSLWHQILLSSADISTIVCWFCFGPTTSFFLGLVVVVLCSSPVTYWTPFNLRDLSFSVVSFCLFYIQFMRFLRQVYWGGLPLPPPVDHVLSAFSTMACLSWVALYHMADNFIELYKPLHQDEAVIHEEGNSINM